MTLHRKLAIRYAIIVAACMALLGGLTFHEFVTEPSQHRAMGAPELPETLWSEYAELFLYGMIPVVLGLGWWIMRKTLDTLDDFAGNVERIHADNLRKPLPRTFNGDEVDRLTGVFNEMAARLDQSIQQIREFTLHASHELKTPLTVMRVQLDTAMRESVALPAVQCEWIHSLRDEVRRLTRIVDTLALLSKADAGMVILEKNPVRLDQLIRENFEDAVILAEAGDIQASLGACEAATVIGDRDRLRQLLLNLTDNAVKYNRPGGSISMELLATGNWAELRMTNTGDGIEPELLARVFDRFVRGENARSRASEGCGLGLAICQWIAQSHRGTIEVSSEPGKLTTFVVRLPIGLVESGAAS